ncbi:ubiquinol-cytochrome c reductase complex assembly factor 2 [Prorops nasuta]|uniref:ubiquinol-cytochrome c reductase complex assembly factor 2 n=1 Tax=Prorops nasuta TaxID=863751 RepID=UPI0034CDAA7D
MAGNYKNFLKLLESWPLDKSKTGKDLGQHIRDQVKIAFSKGEISGPNNQDQCNRYFMSLKRLSSNIYGDTYVRLYTSTASGLSKEQCNLVLSPEMLEYFAQEDLGLIRGTIARIKSMIFTKK